MSIRDQLESFWREKIRPRDQRGRVALCALGVTGVLLVLVLAWQARPRPAPPDDSEQTQKLRALAATRDARNASFAPPEPIRAVKPTKR